MLTTERHVTPARTHATAVLGPRVDAQAMWAACDRIRAKLEVMGQQRDEQAERH